MSIPINQNLASVLAPPVMEARRWVRDTEFPPDRPLLNLSQAAPSLPPPAELRRAMAEAVMELPEAHLYGPVLGDPDLREAVAERWSSHYAAAIEPFDVAITSGCNQAFCAAVTTLCAPGDAVLLAVPWYFNHKMWLDMGGIGSVPLPTGAGLIPSAEDAANLITSKTRAIALVSPNNPGGVEYPDETLAAFLELCRAHGI
ncbi:MAG: aminotransferase class I/II-fold pyridoxal phosphate-dependent enzyme, partial [Pseudomonadota bacterium]